LKERIRDAFERGHDHDDRRFGRGVSDEPPDMTNPVRGGERRAPELDDTEDSTRSRRRLKRTQIQHRQEPTVRGVRTGTNHPDVPCALADVEDVVIYCTPVRALTRKTPLGSYSVTNRLHAPLTFLQQNSK
jgi:hypothetical protein